ncbi:helix-turn-helix transcriptional regulator [Streptomyces xanthochromogenes]|uniref:helix-turn-helix domain-containing protein n=1 Tax=Streptomyces xanthochromogenes TaxID=67384 RepID=UPI003431EF4A
MTAASGKPDRPPGAAAGELARLLRRKRIETGQSMRVLARRVGLSAHSPISDYEQGRRLPPPDLDTALEAALDIPGGTLARLRRQALAERATALLGRDPGPPHTPREAVAVASGAGLGDGAAAVLGFVLGVPATLAVVILWAAVRRGTR